ncbi:MAG: SDR family NAD(P)-dependent oxidoreductase, partial [Afipia sp.]|nr:SDR family NAD(P)-dependent oxidoreductase [Afipia sp.]
MSVKNKSILITGASQGIGRGIALRLAKNGANLALVDIKADKLENVRKEVEALGAKATTYIADVSKRDEVYAAIDHAEAALGGFDVMINNAGIAQVKPLSDVEQK